MRGLWIESGAVSFRADLTGPATPGSPAASGDETRVRVLRAGVCATDLALARGYMNFRGVPGHEFVGLALDGPHANRRVVGEINAACGQPSTCSACASGDERHCPRRTVLGILGRPGAFADELSLPTGNLHRVPAGVADEHAVFAEPLAAAFEIAEQLDLAAFDEALVLGDGRLGCLCAQVIASAGIRVELLGRHPERGEWLPQDVYHRTSPSDRRFPLVVEATGQPEVFQEALARVRPRGTLILKTTSEVPAQIDLAPLVIDEITVLGSRCGPFAPALAALAAGDVVVAPMIEQVYPLEEGPRAFAHAARPGTLKIQLEVTPA